jgi:uncharacterized protein (TIGR03643 family)
MKLEYFKMKKIPLTPIDIEQIILMAWGDTISFEAITREYGLTHNEIVELMRKNQSPKTYARWRERSTKEYIGNGGKHEAVTTVSSRRQKFPI